MSSATADDDTAEETMQQEVTHIMDEARTILPGMQALFGFQTIAVFSQGFEDLPRLARLLHSTALLMTVAAIALAMAPAAFHRIAEAGQVSRRLVQITSVFIYMALMPLMAALALDVFVVLLLATEAVLISTVLAVLVLLCCSVLWFLAPHYFRVHRRDRDHRAERAERANSHGGRRSGMA